MKDLPLKCNFPETNLEDQLDKRIFRTRGERLASPPARLVTGVSDSSKDMELSVAYISERFIDIRTAFSFFRRGVLVVINLFMTFVLLLMWVIDGLFSGEALVATAAFFVPVWIGFYLFEIFFPLTLPVRIDREEGTVYVAHRGTYYRIPWDELEVTFSYNWQYFGSGVMWEKQYYSHLFLRDKYYFCGKAPRKRLQRKKVLSCYKEEHLYRRWNFIVRFYNKGMISEDADNLAVANYDTYLKDVRNRSVKVLIVDHLAFLIFMPTVLWWKFSPFKFKWPKEIEEIFGRINYH